MEELPLPVQKSERERMVNTLRLLHRESDAGDQPPLSSTYTGGRRSANGHIKVRYGCGRIFLQSFPNSDFVFVAPTVVDHFQLQREVVSIAMNHLDRYLADYPFVVDKNKFQLLAMTCLYLSIKLNVYKHLLIPGSRSTMDSILQLSRGFFSLKEMEDMENDILQRLQWHVHPPSPQAFVKHFLYLGGIEDSELLDVSQFMVELSIMDYYFVDYKSSEIAIAAVMNALQRRSPSDRDKAPKHHDESYHHLMGPVPKSLFDYDTSKVRECRDRLHLIFMQANGHVPADEEDSRTPRKTETDDVRTPSPVSVMTPMS